MKSIRPVSICEGDSILLEGIYQTIAGDYTDTLSSVSGCDSIIITTLMINEKAEVTVPVSICSNESYFAGGANQTMTGIYYDTLNTVNGCDSIVITNLEVQPISITNLESEICSNEFYIFAGDTITINRYIFRYISFCK